MHFDHTSTTFANNALVNVVLVAIYVSLDVIIGYANGSGVAIHGTCVAINGSFAAINAPRGAVNSLHIAINASLVAQHLSSERLLLPSMMVNCSSIDQ